MRFVFWKHMLLGAAGAACVGAVVAAPSQINLNGYWDLRVPVGDGTSRNTFFVLHQNDQRINGYVLTEGWKRLPVVGTLQAAGSGKTILSLTVTAGNDLRSMTAKQNPFS